MEPTEQTPVGANTVTQHVGITAIVLGTGDTESVTQAVELLGIDGVHNKTAIDQAVDNWSVRHFDGHGNRRGGSGNRKEPVS